MTASHNVRGRLRDRYPRIGFLPVGFLMGGVLAVGYARNDEPQMAIFGFVLMMMTGIFLAFSKSEYAIAASSEGDERARSIDMEAMRVSYHCLVLVNVCGFLWEVFRGEPGPFSFICFVGATTHALAFAYLKRRR